MSFLKGKTVIITGGGRAKPLSDGSPGSIGYGIATAYAKEGANIVITGRNMQKLLDAKEELEKLYGVKVLPVQADVNAGADNEAIVNNVIGKNHCGIWPHRRADKHCSGLCLRRIHCRPYHGKL